MQEFSIESVLSRIYLERFLSENVKTIQTRRTSPFIFLLEINVTASELDISPVFDIH